METAALGAVERLQQAGLEVVSAASASPGVAVLGERGDPPLRSIVLAAPLDTEARGARLAEESSGVAAVLAAARELAGDPGRAGVRVALLSGERASPPWQGSLGAGSVAKSAALVVYVNRACGLPERRDLLSHRVLRERFFRAAGAAPEPGMFEQADGPQAELALAGARRVLVLNAPARTESCDPEPLAEALVRFARDADRLLAGDHPHRPEEPDPPAAGGGP